MLKNTLSMFYFYEEEIPAYCSLRTEVADNYTLDLKKYTSETFQNTCKRTTSD